MFALSVRRDEHLHDSIGVHRRLEVVTMLLETVLRDYTIRPLSVSLKALGFGARLRDLKDLRSAFLHMLGDVMLFEESCRVKFYTFSARAYNRFLSVQGVLALPRLLGLTVNTGFISSILFIISWDNHFRLGLSQIVDRDSCRNWHCSSLWPIHCLRQDFLLALKLLLLLLCFESQLPFLFFMEGGSCPWCQ